MKKEKLSSYFGTLDTEGKAEVYRKIKTAITPAQLSTMLGILNDTFPTVEEKQVFLVSLYGIAAGKGSLAEYLPDGVTRNPANKAAAAILSVLDGNKSVEEYQREVPAYEKMFGLDGVALVSGNATYENYLSLIKTMYPTDKKLESAFTACKRNRKLPLPRPNGMRMRSRRAVCRAVLPMWRLCGLLSLSTIKKKALCRKA